ncbi:MAG: hypothetical protein K1X92_10525 [Bacteroidia bacterium]|nr:hypothetical protein [Bacteroidia bacterium]
MQNHNKILQAAVLGTSHFFIEIGDTFEGVPLAEAKTTEEKILMISAYQSLRNKAGYEPVDFQGETEFLVCPPETKPYISPQAAEFISGMFLQIKAGDVPVVMELLEAIRKKGRILTPDLLIPVMSYAQKHPVILPLLEATSGERGKWMGNFNKEWNFTNKDLPADWENGSHKERMRSLQESLSVNPKEAVKRLEETWKHETLSQKKDFMNVLYENPVPEASAFLENLIQDTSLTDTELRNRCIHTALLIPGSPVSARLAEYGKTYIQYKAALISGGRIQLEPLKNLSQEMKRDGVGIQVNPPYEASVFNICQLISLLPLHFWAQTLKVKPEDWVKVMKKHDHFSDIWKAITQSAMLYRNGTQLSTVMEYNIPEQNEQKFWDKIIPLFSQEDFGAFSRQLAAKYRGKPTLTTLSLRKSAWGIPESEVASHELVHASVKYAMKNPWDASELLNMIQTASQYAHPDTLKTLSDGVYKISQLSGHWLKDTENALKRIESRAMIKALI